MVIWDIQQNKKDRDLIVRTSPIYSPDGKIIASYQKDRIYLVDGLEYRQTAQYTLNTNVFSLLFSPDSKVLLAFGEDYKYHLLSVATGEQLGESDVIPDGPLAVTFSPDGKYITSLDGYINLYRWNILGMELETSRTDLPLTSPGAYSNDGKYLAITSNQYGTNAPSKILILDANTLEQIYLLEGGHENLIGGLAFSPDSKVLASTDRVAGIVNLWDMSSGKLLRTLEVVPEKRIDSSDPNGVLFGVAFSANGEMVVAVNPIGYRLYFWNASSGELIDNYTLPKNSINFMLAELISFSDDGSQIILDNSMIWDLKKKEYVVPGLVGGVENPAKTLYVYSYRCILGNEFIGEVDEVFCVSTSNTYRETAKGEKFTGKTYGYFNDQFIFNPRGDILLQASDAGVVILWHIKP